MSKKLFFLIMIISVCCPCMLTAQVSISAQLPPAGLVPKEFLWNLIVTNNKEGISDISIRINVQDPASGEILMTGNSGNISLNKGIKILSLRDVQPVQYSYSNQNFSRNYMPLGSYNVCYQVYFGEVVLGEECIRINIDPLSPPLLNTPSDKSVVETAYPQFTWMPPTTIDMFNDLSYDLLITPVDDGQLAVEAIQYNAPVYSRTDIRQTSENYATGFTALENNKTYAWQVVARNGVSYAAKTEVWTFTYRKDTVATLVSGAPYIKLSKAATELAVAHQGFLKMELRNNLMDSTGNFTVRNLSQHEENAGTVGFTFTLPISRGENYIQYDMSKHGKLKKDNVYQVEYRNSLGETWYMKFKAFYYR